MFASQLSFQSLVEGSKGNGKVAAGVRVQLNAMFKVGEPAKKRKHLVARLLRAFMHHNKKLFLLPRLVAGKKMRISDDDQKRFGSKNK